MKRFDIAGMFTARFITKAAIIAALYAVVTITLAPISYGLIQFRISESLMLLAAMTPAAVPGLFAGCIIANLYGGLGAIDIFFGSIATLLAGYLTYVISQRFVAKSSIAFVPGKINKRALVLPLPTILVNAIIIGSYLPFLIPEIRGLNDNLYIVLAMTVGSVMFGELAVTYIIGMPLYYATVNTGIFK